jgi:hypothetical protein
MDDLTDRLHRLADRVGDDDDAFDRLRALRDRRAQSRRVLAGVLALIVAVTGSYVAYSAFRERTTAAPAASVTSTQPPAAALVVCDGRTTRIEVGDAVAGPEGVHVEVINTTDRTLAFAASDTDEFHDVPPGSSTFVESFFFGPGPHFVSCGPEGRLPGYFEQQIHVLDPNGVWIPLGLVCPGAEQWGFDVGVSGSDPVSLSREALGDRVRPGDELRFAGYPASPTRRVVVLLRDGEPIAEVWMKAAEEGWAGYLMNGCP